MGPSLRDADPIELKNPHKRNFISHIPFGPLKTLSCNYVTANTYSYVPSQNIKESTNMTRDDIPLRNKAETP